MGQDCLQFHGCNAGTGLVIGDGWKPALLFLSDCVADGY